MICCYIVLVTHSIHCTCDEGDFILILADSQTNVKPIEKLFSYSTVPVQPASALVCSSDTKSQLVLKSFKLCQTLVD